MPDHPMTLLKHKLNQILEFFPPDSKIAYLEYPVYANIGDLLIMKGTERFFTENKIKVVFRYSSLDFPLKSKFSRDIVLVFQGGGNLGDLWSKIQTFRETCIRQYKQHKIVILPQTLYFEDPTNLERASQIFSQHSDLHLILRDPTSLHIAKNNLCDNVYLMPDMAHALWPLSTTDIHTQNRLFLLRTDKEMGYVYRIGPSSGDSIKDWNQILNLWDMLRVQSLRTLHSMNKITPIFPTQLLWYHLSRELVNKAINYFNRYASVVSSRLHGHILACLLKKPNIILDNSYGKNYSYYRTWTFRVPNARFCEKSRKQVRE